MFTMDKIIRNIKNLNLGDEEFMRKYSNMNREDLKKLGEMFSTLKIKSSIEKYSSKKIGIKRKFEEDDEEEEEDDYLDILYQYVDYSLLYKKKRRRFASEDSDMQEHYRNVCGEDFIEESDLDSNSEYSDIESEQEDEEQEEEIDEEEYI